MARYTGPKTRISRRFGQQIIGSGKAFERRNYPPGQHGPKSRRKVSEYSAGLGEKQKLRYTYGLLERQFRRTFEIAKKERGVTGERFLQLLETRLDSVIYLLGFAKSRAAARQFVNHGHIRINGHKVDIASYNVQPWRRARDQEHAGFPPDGHAPSRGKSHPHRPRLAHARW